MKKKNRIKRLLLCLLAAAQIALSLAVAHLRGLSPAHPFSLNARYLSDGFFVIGMLCTGMGLLIWVSTTGFFDIMGYGFKSLLVLFTPLKKPKDHVSYYDYKMSKEEKRGKPRYTLLWSGLACLLLSALFLAIYYH